MKNKQQTAVEWFYDKIKSHFEHDGDLLETITFTMAIAKQMEMEQINKAYIDGSYTGCGCYDWMKEKDAYEYYNKTYGK